MNGQDALKTLHIRLNMLLIYGNYKADLTKQRLCPYCENEEDTAEHLNFVQSTYHEHTYITVIE